MLLVRVVVIEDDPHERTLLCAEIRRCPIMECPAAYGSWPEAQPHLATLLPDVVLLDLNLSGGPSGEEAARAIKHLLPQIKILVCTDSADRQTIRALLAAGVNGYVLKKEIAGRLPHLLWRVHTGHSELSAQVLDVVVESLAQDCPSLLESLSPVEHTILDARQKGQSYKQICERLGFTNNTLKTHVSRILDKTCADSTTQSSYHRHQASM